MFKLIGRNCEREQIRRIIILLLLSTALSLTASNTHPNTKNQIHTVSKGLNFFKTTITTPSSSNAAIASACKSTLYPDACHSALAGASPKSSLKDLFVGSVESARLRATSARAAAYNLSPAHGAIDDCLELLDISLEQLDDVINAAAKKSKSSAHDIQTWLSAALTNQVTCSDGIGATGIDPNRKKDMMAQVNVLSQHISNALALHASMTGSGGGRERRLSDEKFPGWLSSSDRKLLQASPADIQAVAVVAKDGSGTHSTINEAIAFVSLKSNGGGGGRSVIYVKAGTYREYIRIPTKQKNVMLMGDGKGQSIVIGSRNAEDGSSTYQSATVAAMGAGFIAKGITIINDSGPDKQQAVALRVGADQAVIYQCAIQGYQDSLYTYANRQFYRDCDISGTVDFIFGNSAAVFQNCFIQPRKPAGGQRNSITAQGRTDPNQNTGISIQGCRISGSTGGAPTYLGRPWKQYSRVVFMESEIDGSVSSAGWEQWSGNFALKTLYYGEYANTGAGAGTSGRVKWPGVHSDLSASEASKFTVANFISGTSWIPGTGAQFNAGL
ncbi:pectinesterase-like [Dendrobium catenatum]|uniref:Pectinesterase n=1 Tax=Dendrobium catenatum TaxID=906689 RepID=A0A2I0VZH6_9ASPA|nr:pectinesterase-like [Dendrobium catenatum]PKU68807.1 putative pectinesterase/pectinesterase inhibitor 35 [Dendrobium catenatum]